MNYEGRNPPLERVEQLRAGRRLVCFLNFDRQSEPALPGLLTHFSADVKEALFRVLKDSDPRDGIDLLLYTRRTWWQPVTLTWTTYRVAGVAA